MDYENLVPADAQGEGAKREPDGKMHRQDRQKMKGIIMRNLIELSMLVTELKDVVKILVKMEYERRISPPEVQWMDSSQARKFLNVKRATLQNLRDKGVLPYSNVNGKLYYKTSDLLKLLETNYRKKGH